MYVALENEGRKRPTNEAQHQTVKEKKRFINIIIIMSHD